jgi:hypothetical protein
MNTSTNLRDGLLASGVKNLKEFGFPGTTKENILTDLMYREFFRKMLEDWKDEHHEIKSFVLACDELLKEIPV